MEFCFVLILQRTRRCRFMLLPRIVKSIYTSHLFKFSFPWRKQLRYPTQQGYTHTLSQCIYRKKYKMALNTKLIQVNSYKKCIDSSKRTHTHSQKYTHAHTLKMHTKSQYTLNTHSYVDVNIRKHMYVIKYTYTHIHAQIQIKANTHTHVHARTRA